MTCTKAHCGKIGECPFCIIDELKRDVARYENGRLILSNMIKERDEKIKDLEARLALIKAGDDFREER